MAKCADCKFWNRNTEEDSNSGPHADCVRYPPQVDMKRMRSYGHELHWRRNIWPVTFYNDWCGEFQAK